MQGEAGKREVDFKVKFGGKLNEVNVNTFLKSLASISTVVDEINKEVGEGQKLEIRIKATERGSFLVHLGLLSSQIADLIGQMDFELASKVVTMLVGIFTLRKLLKGEPPEGTKEGKDDVTVTTKSGNTITIDKRTFHIYSKNVTINEALADTFDALNSDKSIDSFEIQGSDEESLFEAPREDFEMMSVKGLSEIPEEKLKILTQSATLHIFKLVWDKNRKWEFFYKGTKISAIITDDSFFANIEKGEPFSKGDSLQVEMEIKQRFDNSVNTYINEAYFITKVIKHIPRPDQGRLNI